MVEFTDEMRLKMARLHLQDIANRHDGVLLNGNITKVAHDSGVKVNQLKEYITNYPIGR